MSEQTLTSLAILTVNWNHGHDTIESFVPLVAECLRTGPSQPVSGIDLQKAMQKECGLKIPIAALQVILHRCQKRGYVKNQNRVYIPVKRKLDEVDFASTKKEALRQHACVLQKLRAFVSGRYQLSWQEEEADEALLAYLEEGSLPILVASAEGQPLPRPKHRQSRKTKHIMSAFAGYLDESDPEGFKCLETVVKGHILSSVLFYPDLGQVETRFKQLDVYCDTPFLLRAIGYTEDGLHIQCVELIELLRDLGANLKCFHHTREEVVGVLEREAAQHRPEAKVNDTTADYYTSKSFRLTEIEELIIGLSDAFMKLDIEVVDTPAWTEQPDEVRLDEAIAKEMRYYRAKAREKDAKSLAAIARLRGLRRMEKIESARAIFVTTNTSLARVSSHFFRDTEGRNGIPICMPVGLLTRLAWVKKPLAKPDLPRHMVVASSYAALNPPTPLWREYLCEINKRRDSGKLSDTDYHVLRSSQEARRALMDETYGDEAAFTAGTLDEVLAHARAEIRADEAARTDSEREGRITAEKTAEIERKRRELVEETHRELIRDRGRRLGSTVGWLTVSVVVGVFVVGVLASIPGFPLLSVKSQSWRIVIWICLILFLASQLLQTLFKVGMNLPRAQEAISKWVERQWCDRKLQRLEELYTQPSNPNET